MNEKQWKEVRRLYNAALDLEEPEREKFLQAECGEDAEILRDVLALLADSADVRFLTWPLGDSGRVLGDFELLEEIGVGGTGTVFRAWQRSLNREVALKVLPEHFSLNEDRVERFRREARAAAKLKHPSIAPIYEVGCEGTFHFIAMELVDGPDLAGELTAVRGNVAIHLGVPNTEEYFKRTAKVVLRIASALAYSHGMGVIHRDVKPNNILINAKGDPKLVDFGLARDDSQGTVTETDRVEGTPYYMSPEQARAIQERVDERTDVYSLGAVLYEMCTLSRPHEGRTTREVIEKITVHEPRSIRIANPKVPTDLAVICEKAMERELVDRYASASELEDDLGRFLAGEPILAKRASPTRRALRYVRRNRVAIGATAGLVLALIGAKWTYTWTAQVDWIPIQIESETASVYATRLEISGAPTGGEEVNLGKTPVNTKLPVGTWLCRVEAADGRRAEVLFSLDPGGETLKRRVTLTSLEEIRLGMIRIEPLLWRASGACTFLPNSVTLPPFYVDQNEVTVDQYRDFCEATEHPLPSFWARLDVSRLPGNFPITGISAEDAEAYAGWKGKRLLTHAEYEYLLHGPNNAKSSWGDEAATPEHRKAAGPYLAENAPIEERFEHFLTYASPVGSYPKGATPEGVLDIIGNVAEYLGTPGMELIDGEVRPMKGLSFEVDAGYIQGGEVVENGFAHFDRPATSRWRPLHMGFRCASTARDL